MSGPYRERRVALRVANEDEVEVALHSEARKLTDEKENVEEMAWSPDSKRIAYSARVRDAAGEEEDDKKRAPRRFTWSTFAAGATPSSWGAPARSTTGIGRPTS